MLPTTHPDRLTLMILKALEWASAVMVSLSWEAGTNDLSIVIMNYVSPGRQIELAEHIVINQPAVQDEA